jgi:hypothetical protein
MSPIPHPAARCPLPVAGAARSAAGRPASDTGRSGGVMVWLPWLCAPAFALLPIAGCGLAGAVYATSQAATGTAVAKGSLPPLLPGPRDPRLVRIGAVMPTALPRR